MNERPGRQHTKATIYILDEEAVPHLGIAPGSGIVGIAYDEISPGAVLLYYEGNLYDAQNQREHEERIINAAGRLFTRYPTVAMQMVTAEDAARGLVAVGEIDRNYQIRYYDEDAHAKARAYGARCTNGAGLR